MQYVLFCPKYCIKKYKIFPNSLISITISLIVTVVFMSLFILSTYWVNLEKDTLGYTTFMLISSKYDCMFYCVGFAMNFVTGLLQTNSSIQFVLVFQRVHRILIKDASVKKVINSSWFLGSTGIYVIISTGIHILLRAPFFSIYVCYLMLVFDYNVFYAIRLLKLLENKVVLWNVQVLNSQEIENTLSERNQQLYQAYVDIIKCYDIYKSCFQQLVST